MNGSMENKALSFQLRKRSIDYFSSIYRTHSQLKYLVILSIIRRIGASTIIYSILVTILIFFAFLLIIYLLGDPIDKTTSSIRYPYILSAKPALLQKGHSERISLSSSVTMQGRRIELVSINPDGYRYPAISNQSRSNTITWTFPNDFMASSNLIGNYSLLLITGASNQNLTSLSFYVVDNPFLYSLSNFLLGKGVGIAVGIIIPIITISYQILSQGNQDRARRSEDKADWMIKNMNFYFSLIADSNILCEKGWKFEKGKRWENQEPEYKNFDAENILINTIKFYKDHVIFDNNTGVYFFDDLRIEDFIARTDQRIMSLTRLMLDDKYTNLSQFNEIENERFEDKFRF